jgi:hypothetical protein
MGETTLNKKMRAFDDEVALTVAAFYLVRMLQLTLPAGFIYMAHHRKYVAAAVLRLLAQRPLSAMRTEARCSMYSLSI